MDEQERNKIIKTLSAVLLDGNVPDTVRFQDEDIRSLLGGFVELQALEGKPDLWDKAEGLGRHYATDEALYPVLMRLPSDMEISRKFLRDIANQIALFHGRSARVTIPASQVFIEAALDAVRQRSKADDRLDTKKQDRLIDVLLAERIKITPDSVTGGGAIKEAFAYCIAHYARQSTKSAVKQNAFRLKTEFSLSSFFHDSKMTLAKSEIESMASALVRQCEETSSLHGWLQHNNSQPSSEWGRWRDKVIHEQFILHVPDATEQEARHVLRTRDPDRLDAEFATMIAKERVSSGRYIKALANRIAKRVLNSSATEGWEIHRLQEYIQELLSLFPVAQHPRNVKDVEELAEVLFKGVRHGDVFDVHGVIANNMQDHFVNHPDGWLGTSAYSVTEAAENIWKMIAIAEKESPGYYYARVQQLAGRNSSPYSKKNTVLAKARIQQTSRDILQSTQGVDNIVGMVQKVLSEQHCTDARIANSVAELGRIIPENVRKEVYCETGILQNVARDIASHARNEDMSVAVVMKIMNVLHYRGYLYITPDIGETLRQAADNDAIRMREERREAVMHNINPSAYGSWVAWIEKQRKAVASSFGSKDASPPS